DDVVQQHGVHSARDQIGIGMDVVVVRERDQTHRVPRGDEQVVRDRGTERRDATAAQIGEATDSGGVFRPYREYFAKLEIGNGDGVTSAAHGHVLDPGEA